jgi:hypothetical protein
MVSVNALLPNRSVRTAAVAPDCAECPEIYDGLDGTTRYDNQAPSLLP